MMLVHESGHMLAAVASGGTVQRLVFGPLESCLAHSIFPQSASPLCRLGRPGRRAALFPLAFSIGLRIAQIRFYLAQLFSAFCLLANGAYIGVGSFDRVGDSGDMLKYGCPPWTLWLFGGRGGSRIDAAVSSPWLAPRTDHARQARGCSARRRLRRVVIGIRPDDVLI